MIGVSLRGLTIHCGASIHRSPSWSVENSQH
jgi:hypothetical protein